MAQRLLKFGGAILHEKNASHAANAELIEVSAPVSTAAVLYEKVRSTIDYQEEHLLRRNAILRFLRRHLGSDASLQETAELLLKELVWAKYLPNKSIPTGFAGEIVPIFAKAGPLLAAADGMKGYQDKATDWVLDVLSTELEYKIVSHVKEEALVSFMYEEERMRMSWDKAVRVAPEERDLLLYVAIHKTLLVSNEATLRFRVLTLYYPNWSSGISAEEVATIAAGLPTILPAVERIVHHPMIEKLCIALRRKTGVFRVLSDIVTKQPEHVPELVEDPESMDEQVAKVLREHMSAFGGRLRRTVFRTVAFLFLTKMLLALILEVPYDYFILGATDFVPLGINIFFHPLFLALISLTVSLPEKKNVIDYQEAVRAILVGADHQLLHIRMKDDRRGALFTFFTFLYAVLFLAIYTAIGFVLSGLGFSWLSTTLFLFFFSLVTFFGVKIRQSAKDIIVSDARSGFVGSFFDILMLPIVRMGRWLSANVAKINVFIYFFDFIVEAPFKVAIRVIESWFAFVREKKEEI